MAHVTEWLCTFSICCEIRPWTGHVAQTPARHGIGLREPVEYERPLGHARQRGDARVSLAVVEDLLVHLVREDEQIAFLSERGDGGELRIVEHPAGRVVRRVDQQDARRGSPRGGERFARQSPVVVRVKRHRHGRAAGELDHWPVRDPGRLRNHHVDAGLDKGEGRFEERLFSTRGDDDAAVGVDLDPIVGAKLVGDRLAQTGNAGACHIVRVAGVHRLGRGRADVLGGDEIRIAATEIDDVDPLGLELPGAVGDRERRRRREIAHTTGEECGGRALRLR